MTSREGLASTPNAKLSTLKHSVRLRLKKRMFVREGMMDEKRSMSWMIYKARYELEYEGRNCNEA